MIQVVSLTYKNQKKYAIKRTFFGRFPAYYDHSFLKWVKPSHYRFDYALFYTLEDALAVYKLLKGLPLHDIVDEQPITDLEKALSD